MENVRIINKVGKGLMVNVDNADGVIEVTVGYPENRVKLFHLNLGDVFKADGVDYVVLEQFRNGNTAVIRKEALSNRMIFNSDDNNWERSCIRRFLNSEYLEKLEETFRKDNIMNHVTDLLSLDGLSDYGKCIDKVGLLSVEQYRRYREAMGDNLYESENAWWLATPDSTDSGFGSNGVLHVGSMGDIGCSVCDFSMYVRPYFVLAGSAMVTLVDHVGK